MRSKPADAIKAPDVPIVLTDKFNVTTIMFKGTRNMFMAVERIVFGMYDERKVLMDGKYNPTVPVIESVVR